MVVSEYRCADIQLIGVYLDQSIRYQSTLRRFDSKLDDIFTLWLDDAIDSDRFIPNETVAKNQL